MSECEQKLSTTRPLVFRRAGGALHVGPRTLCRGQAQPRQAAPAFPPTRRRVRTGADVRRHVGTHSTQREALNRYRVGHFEHHPHTHLDGRPCNLSGFLDLDERRDVELCEQLAFRSIRPFPAGSELLMDSKHILVIGLDVEP